MGVPRAGPVRFATKSCARTGQAPGWGEKSEEEKQKARPKSGFLLETGAPEEIRTPDPLVRSQVLYPAELRAP